MPYAIKEIFGPTIQGEGSMIGTPTHFIRFSGCNMWDGRPETRAKSKCPYCDTDFFGGTKMGEWEILEALRALKPRVEWVTISGGEPLLQFDETLANVLKAGGFKIALETNGTKKVNREWFDHITCSPKVPFNEMELMSADTLKLLYPHPNPDMTPDSYLMFDAKEYYLQPIMDVPMFGDPEEIFEKSVKATLEKIYDSGGNWKLSPQIHKIIKVK